MGALRWRHQREHEAAVRALYEDRGMPGAPKVHYGYDTTGREVLHALVSHEEWQPGELRWHVSISGPERVPTWSEVAAALHELRPGVPFVMGVPPRSWWMNVHSDVLHAWETTDALLIDQWRANRRGDAPS